MGVVNVNIVGARAAVSDGTEGVEMCILLIIPTGNRSASELTSSSGSLIQVMSRASFSMPSAFTASPGGLVESARCWIIELVCGLCVKIENCSLLKLKSLIDGSRSIISHSEIDVYIRKLYEVRTCSEP